MNRSPRLVYQQGDHVCTLFSSREEQVTAAIDYILPYWMGRYYGVPE